MLSPQREGGHPNARTTDSSAEREHLDLYLRYRGFMAAAASTGRGDLGGRLLLLSDARAAGAARLAGGAVLLALSSDAEAKGAMQAGLCDFVVWSLDEALRILKNEIRRRTSVSVCLRATVPELQQWCVERGVQPDFVDAAEPTLAARGAQLVRWPSELAHDEALVLWEAAPAVLGAWERSALRVLPQAERERRRWVEQAPAAFGRSFRRTRVLPLSAKETEALLELLARDGCCAGLTARRHGRQIWPAP